MKKIEKFAVVIACASVVELIYELHSLSELRKRELDYWKRAYYDAKKSKDEWRDCYFKRNEEYLALKKNTPGE